MQTLRFMLQKSLAAATLSAAGSTFARFFYSAPAIVALAGVYLAGTGQALPELGGRFWVFTGTGAVSQVLATVCTVALFKERAFAVGITFKKTEAVQTALVSALVLGEFVSLWGGVAIAIGLIGVVLLSDPPGTAGQGWRRFLNRAAGLGLLSGILFAISAVSYRGASTALDSADPFLRAGVTLACVTSVQLVGMALWLAWRQPAQLGAVVRAWRVAGLVGITSMMGSFCWFTAFTLQNAAYVNALGQVELIFSVSASVFFFREKLSRREASGIVFLGVSILALILVA